MDLQTFLKAIRARWISIFVTTLIVFIAAVAVTVMATPIYQASTRLFVSTTSGTSISETYQGNRLSQDRVLSYIELLGGQNLAQRTIDKLGLNMSANELAGKVTASSKADTVLINLSVRDQSPVRARDIANQLSDEFVYMVRDLETPHPGAQPDARVVVEQRASIPSKPVSPDRKRNLGAGLALGLLLGIGIAILREVLDNTVKNRETLEDITGTGVVGVIPLDKERLKEPAIHFDRDNSPMAESFRKLRTNLQFLSVDSPPRVIVVVSSVPSEGKSTTAVNIALALAEAENEVVLVDGDMRRPMLHNYLDLVGSVGFSTVLSGGVTLSEALQSTSYSRLTVLAAGTIPPNPSELLGSDAAKHLLGELRSKFDYVIVDSSPLLAVTDGAILAASSDGAIVITRFGETKRDQLAHAVASVQDVDATLLGAVLNMNPARADSDYSYNYGSYGVEPAPRRSLRRRFSRTPRPTQQNTKIDESLVATNVETHGGA